MTNLNTEDLYDDVVESIGGKHEDFNFNYWTRRYRASRCSPVIKNFGIIISPDGDGTYDIINEEPKTYEQLIRGKQVIFERKQILSSFMVRSILNDMVDYIKVRLDKIVVIEECYRDEFSRELDDIDTTCKIDLARIRRSRTKGS